jgi:hypothetical protein
MKSKALAPLIILPLIAYDLEHSAGSRPVRKALPPHKVIGSQG